jgi:hypothetical protein
MNDLLTRTGRQLTRADILPLGEYAKIRRQRRRQISEIKQHRRLEVGPFATFYFENLDTMWQQIQEMLYIEKGGDAQIADELEAYNPLIPQGNELVATVMFEIDDPDRRKAMLGKLGGVEESAFLRVGGETIPGQSEEDLDRTTAEGKASSVQFIHFAFTAGQKDLFRRPGTEVVLGFAHPEYSHMALLSEASRAALAEDFD